MNYFFKQPMIRLASIACMLATLSSFHRIVSADEPSNQSTAEKPTKNLILPGESFVVEGHPAFIFPSLGKKDRNVSSEVTKPWILYAPTLAAYPDEAERWMHEQFTAAGVAVAGIDSGESYGSPAGIRCTEQLHAEMVKRGYSKKPCAFGRSRGGLWASAWAIAHPELCAGIAGIYPVYDWRTYPGADKAAAAYGLSQEQLLSKVDELCPIERMTVAAKAGIPVFIIHGDADTTVPLDRNSAELKKRYESVGAGKLVELEVVKGQGHNLWEGFFRSTKLVAFAIAQAKAGAAEPVLIQGK